jgi:hypothetical protein
MSSRLTFLGVHMNVEKTKLVVSDFHPHLEARMSQRGVTKEELQTTLVKGWEADDAKAGTAGKVFVFPYNREWVGKTFAEKEVTVYYKLIGGEVVLLTVKARYGNSFPKGGGEDANRV